MTDAKLTLSFTGASALVTGGRSGIGAATVDLLSRSGLSVIVLDLAGVDEGVVHPSVVHTVANVTDEVAVEKELERLVGDKGISYVVNCAGIHRQAGVESLSAGDWHQMLDVNLVGAALTTKAALPWLRGAPGAAVVNVTSLEATRVVALINPVPVPHYAASKAALAMLTCSMARDLGRFGIRVNSVAPGFIRTPMTHANHAGMEELSGLVADRVPMRRYGKPEEVAGAIAFLLSDGASYMTGSSLLIDGGFSTT